MSGWMIRVHFLYMGCHVALVVKTHVAQWTSEEKVSRSMFCCNVSIKLKFFCKTLVAYITFVFVDSLVCFNMPQQTGMMQERSTTITTAFCFRGLFMLSVHMSIQRWHVFKCFVAFLALVELFHVIPAWWSSCTSARLIVRLSSPCSALHRVMSFVSWLSTICHKALKYNANILLSIRKTCAFKLELSGQINQTKQKQKNRVQSQ